MWWQSAKRCLCYSIWLYVTSIDMEYCIGLYMTILYLMASGEEVFIYSILSYVIKMTCIDIFDYI
jgi:hypothetical protein